ncbi:myeloid-associated differentiation marker-like protein 2 [Syngnathoides biaculeatus]|uniref:myeloid-associated differentiation marker-like protein 2 n=1 Tax=Syngnathoides biaculeatus TaxID=300417 RepID=UPI002ADD86CA|nr:myeloid-associated differentiation marker-like protein 2 [Syngnathoides biaculeatus]
MPVIVLEPKDFASPLFWVRSWEVLSSCTTFSLVTALESSELTKNSLHLQHLYTIRMFCIFTWSFFFTLTLLIQILTTIQFHNLLPVSWKNLTVTAAVLGSLMCLSAAIFFPLLVMERQQVCPRPVAAAVTSGLAFLAYTSECYILCSQVQEQRGFVGSIPGLLKIVQLWGSLQMIPLLVEADHGLSSGVPPWQLWASGSSYGVCILMSVITLGVILGDFAGQCRLPFDKVMVVFTIAGLLLYMVATVICFDKVLQLKNSANKSSELVIMETVVACIALLAYTVDLTFSIKILRDRSHT